MIFQSFATHAAVGTIINLINVIYWDVRVGTIFTGSLKSEELSDYSSLFSTKYDIYGDKSIFSNVKSIE